jgi:hypothetical protein
MDEIRLYSHNKKDIRNIVAGNYSLDCFPMS